MIAPLLALDGRQVSGAAPSQSASQRSTIGPMAAGSFGLRGLALGLALALAACRSAHGEPSAEVIDPRAVPVQDTADPSMPTALPAAGDVALTARARYRVTARVLSKERYYVGWRGAVSPLDLALGWGAMSDPEVDRFVEWYQRGRWYFWQWSAGSPYQNVAIREQSANVHIVPANRNLRRALLALDDGDIVRLSGFLIDATGPDGDHWRSSLSRTDTGDRSCEVLYVEELAAAGRLYR